MCCRRCLAGPVGGCARLLQMVIERLSTFFKTTGLRHRFVGTQFDVLSEEVSCSGWHIHDVPSRLGSKSEGVRFPWCRTHQLLLVRVPGEDPTQARGGQRTAVAQIPLGTCGARIHTARRCNACRPGCVRYLRACVATCVAATVAATVATAAKRW